MGAFDVHSAPPGAQLPPFLKSWQSPQRSGAHARVPLRAVYTHKQPFGQAQVLWWPHGMRALDSTVVPRTVLLFIPGNPGLLDMYVPFLDAVHRGAISNSESSESPGLGRVTIFAHAHLGLTSYVRGGDGSFPAETSHVELAAQIQAHVEFLDELLAAYGPATRVLLVGHSIGAWFIQEVLKARKALRPRVGAYLLCPTLSHIARSPKGKKLLPFFRPPWPRVVSYLSLLVVQQLPSWVLMWILDIRHPSWPPKQHQVLHDFLRAPAALYAAFTMANDEMDTVLDLDADFFREFAENVWFYYAHNDHWVGEEREVVLRALRETPAENHVVHGRADIPHAFCINHHAEVAAQCIEWMREGGFLDDVTA
ncbi:hypothetical protein BJV74DRAFT_300115 [Russula compacta]|nr:hypothetical protein BJV74DRAFT_300115 [Russula compacta]